MTEQAAPNLHTNILNRIANELALTYQGVFSSETINRYVFESYVSLARTAKIRTHLPILAERFAKDRLHALAVAEGKVISPVPQVLFVCIHNAGRSQIASALLSHYAGSSVEVRSAGSLPTSEVHPLVLEILSERGVNISDAFPKPLTDDVVRASDYVITMGCGDVCPIYPGKHYFDWELTDLSDEGREKIQEIIEEIDGRIRELWKSIQATQN